MKEIFIAASNPKTWVNPIKSKALYDFKASQRNELPLRAGQEVLVAPKEVQNTHKLLNTGWALASIDQNTSGLIPISYLQGPQQPAEPRQSLAFNSSVNSDVLSKPTAVDTTVQSTEPMSFADCNFATNDLVGPQLEPQAPVKPTTRLFGDIPKLGSNNIPVVNSPEASQLSTSD